MNFSTIPILSQLGVTAVSTVVGFSPLSRPHQTLRNNEQRATIPYVAFGDSLTTGSSIRTCRDNRARSPWGCTENPTAAVPYPDRVAQALGYRFSDAPQDYIKKNLTRSPLDLYRAGTWGYTVQEAANINSDQQDWFSQLEVISRASELVTGSLGINDLHFSNISKWAKLYLRPGRDRVTPAVRSEIAARDRDFDKLFKTLNQAKKNGATVVVGLYYNPYDSANPDCNDLMTIGSRIVDTLDNELSRRARNAGFDIADFRRPFRGHGAGSADPFVFGQECTIGGALSSWFPAWMQGHNANKAVAIAFDPHPNNKGTTAMAKVIMEQYNNAD